MCIKGKKAKINLNFGQVTALAFLSIIIWGTLLLALPFASASQRSNGLLTSLFTATSAVCVTGLSVVDVWTSYSFFGQLIILILMETGGLGFMSVVSLLFYITSRKNDVQSLSLMADSLGSDGLKDIARIQKRLIIGSLFFELAGAIILFFQFLPQFGILKALWLGIFHSVSAFCNAGFDLMGINIPGSSLTSLQTNPVVLLTVAFLIIIGGIGFVAWDDISTAKHPRNWSVNTKLVLITSGALLLFGTIAFLAIEYNNPASIGTMSFGNKLANAFFQSASPRTGGFAAINVADLKESSIALTTLLMIIGGAAGSTAGGIKVVTFTVLIVSIYSNIIGKKHVTILHRTISPEQVTYAFTVIGSFIILSLLGGFFVNATSDISFVQAYFESVSALATVGLSFGVTSLLSIPSKLIIIIFMFIGRVGLLTLTLGFLKSKENIAMKYPSVKIMIG